jgi:hypothetical protein
MPFATVGAASGSCGGASVKSQLVGSDQDHSFLPVVALTAVSGPSQAAM